MIATSLSSVHLYKIEALEPASVAQPGFRAHRLDESLEISLNYYGHRPHSPGQGRLDTSE